MYNTDHCNKYELTKKIGFLIYCHLSLLFIHVENIGYIGIILIHLLIKIFNYIIS